VVVGGRKLVRLAVKYVDFSVRKLIKMNVNFYRKRHRSWRPQRRLSCICGKCRNVRKWGGSGHLAKQL
jgi:hypothetical protein